MDITSVTYLIFVAVSLLFYWHMPTRWQWRILLLDNVIFYLWDNSAAYTGLYLLVSVLSVWLSTNFFQKTESEPKKKAALIGTILINAGLLAVLKYTNLVLNTINYLSRRAEGEQIPLVSWAASLGISFYT
ncbi:MAG: hypothetical protein K5641_01245, partial [Lachnospiraceae bacterium]|nr:hypothetical protein [Lachnospiraceae bacterium]